ncbi:N-acetyltransferase [Actinorhabdospora filicis]|uniref:N-acetyltransferase n=1 Tax=Actinorhabdospora filicis TaxID=1785913 RepID=A0A9W6SLE3_9ACTN|nr:GNAT family N-acetyltransferase [Actinorhabdospora filicis]GLZ78393.1 N-acetyltransferase [Actinorhabdospora filicis]
MIRTATPADAAAIAELKVRAWRAAYAEFMDLDGLDAAAETADWAEYLDAIPGEHRLWVTVVDGEVAGFCRTGPATEDLDLGPAAGEVYGLYLDPARIGTGLGRELFAHAVSDLETRGHDPVCVYAYVPNTGAIAFYERAGFARDGVERLDEEIGVPEARLARIVNKPR